MATEWQRKGQAVTESDTAQCEGQAGKLDNARPDGYGGKNQDPGPELSPYGGVPGGSRDRGWVAPFQGDALPRPEVPDVLESLPDGLPVQFAVVL